MKKLCAWHPKNFGRELDMGEVGEEEGITHGMCEDCFKIEMKNSEVNRKDLGTNCWSSNRFYGHRRCPRWEYCSYPERKDCRAREAEIAYFRGRRVAILHSAHEYLEKINKLERGEG